MVKIAFVGLGAMGLRMANRLAQAKDVDLAVFDLVPEQVKKMEGSARLATSIGDVAKGADAIFSVVPADRHTRAVVDELVKVAEPGQTFVDFSTIGPATIEEVGDRLAAVNVGTISAGMTKSIGGATNGTLSLFMGGPAEVSEKLRPAFDAIATDLMMVGSLGAAKALKLVNNMVVATLDIAITEALALGQQYGITMKELTDAMIAGGADNWPLHNHIIDHVLPNDLGPGFFSTRFLIKDLKLYSEFSSSINLPAFFTALALSDYRGTAAHGMGDDYHMIVVRWFEQGAKVGERPVTALPAGEDKAAVIARIVAGVAAIQALVSAEAIRILGRKGVEAKDAAFYLDSGSAGNDSLRAMVRHLDGEAAAVTPSDVIKDLTSVIALCDAADVPGAVFEVGRQMAIGLIDRYGTEVDLWKCVIGQ
ncbi:MAG: NAD(P)-dependent oxidoreductase [Bauldia sp.]|nr:NAD(P)-dependent oxidoreductase [Bauldia sp.]